MFIFRGTTLRGPYETSLNEFVDCVCTVLEEGKSYTYNQARKKCGVSYQTVEDYVTIERSDVNLRIVEECGRSVKPEDIRRTYPGLRVYPLGDGLSHPDSCLTELGKETENVICFRNARVSSVTQQVLAYPRLNKVNIFSMLCPFLGLTFINKPKANTLI
jgi:hypothetical protein